MTNFEVRGQHPGRDDEIAENEAGHTKREEDWLASVCGLSALGLYRGYRFWRYLLPGCNVESTIFFACHRSGLISLISPSLYFEMRCLASCRPDEETKRVLYVGTSATVQHQANWEGVIEEDQRSKRFLRLPPRQRQKPAVLYYNWSWQRVFCPKYNTTSPSTTHVGQSSSCHVDHIPPHSHPRSHGQSGPGLRHEPHDSCSICEARTRNNSNRRKRRPYHPCITSRL